MLQDLDEVSILEILQQRFEEICSVIQNCFGMKLKTIDSTVLKTKNVNRNAKNRR